MPRIVPIQLLKCLKVLLDDNGGILSAGEVKRLASLMTKYSKKLVSKCIYVQILKCTKTELLGEFMGAGGWSLVYTWLNDAIRAMNWPLVQEILELLLLCPVDVHRLKINSAPKLVKGLCKDGGNEGVRILAKRLVEQWLKVVTENPEATLPPSNITPQAAATKIPTVAVVAPEAISVNVQQQQTSVVNSTNNNAACNAQQQQQQLQQKQEEQKAKSNQQKFKSSKKSLTTKLQDFNQEEEPEIEKTRDRGEVNRGTQEEEDPLGGVDAEATVTNYTLTPAQKKASESGLVYKFIIKDGQSILAKVPPKANPPISALQPQSSVEEEEEAESNEMADEDADENETAENMVNNSAVLTEADEEDSSSLDKIEKDNDSNSGSEEKVKVEDGKKSEDKKSHEDVEKSGMPKDRRSSKDKERRVSSSSIDKEKDKDSKTSKSSSASSSSGHRSSSSHKSSSSSSSKSSSSSSKSKSSSSSSSSSSHRSSSDKHRSDKERSSSNKDKDKDRSNSSSSSSKHKSSSSSSKSSSSSSSSSKDKYREKEKSSSSSSKPKDKLEQSQSEKDRAHIEKIISSNSLDKLGKIPKKPKDLSGGGNDSEGSIKSTSITIPSKKASMSIEIRKDTEKAKTVKTYKSQFRSHGLTEEAPPPPSRKGLKKPSSSTPPGTVLPSSLPSSLKRSSPPPRDLSSEKKAKIDINNVSVANEKPGAIKLIPPKKIQTLVETNLFSDALSAATGPKKVTKRKRPNTPSISGKDGTVSPTSPDAPKVMPLKFYQDTLDESKNDDSKSNKENDESAGAKPSEELAVADDKDIEDDDDIPLKKVKEDIEQKVAKEKRLDCADTDGKIIIVKDDAESNSSPSRQELSRSPNEDEDDDEIMVEKKPGPGCGPNGPPGVLMLHRRKGPKKKLSWHPQETLEQIRYFELDENERCNVTKTSFLDMKNLERFNERDAIVMARRGFNHEDNMEVQTHWKPLIEVDDVPPHPEGNQSKQRKIQAEREQTTLRALYFTHALIPDSPAEAEFEPALNHDVPLIPLDDLTGNPDAVNDFTSMPWPEPRGSPKQGDNSMSGTGGLGSPVNIFDSPPQQVINSPNNNKQSSGNNPYNNFTNPFTGNQGPNVSKGPPMQNSPQNPWQGPGNSMGGPIGGSGPMMGNSFNGNNSSPIVDIGIPGPMGPGPMMNNGPPPNFINPFSPNFSAPPNPFIGVPPGFNNGPNNFGPMGPNGPMMNGMGPPVNMGNNFPNQMMNSGHGNRNNRGNNNGGNWRIGGNNFQDNGGNWRPAGSGPNMRGGGGGNGNNGICKAFMRGHCRLGNSCKYIHPNKSKRI